MSVFVDTSALYSALDIRDANHQAARERWTDLLTGDEPLITSNYVLVEANALLARRAGMHAVRIFQAEFVPALKTFWIDEAIHRRAVSALLTAGLRDLSLVDCVSFEVMRQLELETAFAFDVHFARQGFRCIPGQL